MLRPLLQLKTSLNIMKTHTSYEKRTLFINNYLVFSKNYIMPPYKKLQTLISAFIKNLIFGKNRDPCKEDGPSVEKEKKKCNICEKNLALSSFSRDMKDKHGTTQACKICRKSFQTLGGLESHQSKAHVVKLFHTLSVISASTQA